ncbi:MAG: NADH-quinone oxidoreductase subunit C [Eubacterium sp.]|nr:NADH-quinone oxidoreductase subunit C [Eubacterium sp.]
MAEVICPENKLFEITPEKLLSKTMEMKKRGFRLSQACAALIKEDIELSYSFANDDTYEFETLRIVTDQETEIPSITEILPSAVFYENEMKELFGVNIKMINLDYDNKLYRIEVESPMAPKKPKEGE